MGRFWDLVGPVGDRATQLDLAAFSMADGGLAGQGLGLGSPTTSRWSSSDFIFAAITEELGLLGSAAVLIAFLLMIGAGLRIAQQAATGFERLFATGLTTLLGFQAFIIMAGVVRLLPLTGVTLPFISYGRSSLLANRAAGPAAADLRRHRRAGQREDRGPPDDRGRPGDQAESATSACSWPAAARCCSCRRTG